MIKSFTVSQEHTAAYVGSGTLPVLATPILAVWIENLATELAESLHSTEESTVGTNITLDHLKKSKVGETITCHVDLIAQDRRKLTFSAVCLNEVGEQVATASHTRFIINISKFMA
mgnify:CR=1 FL=1